MNFPSKYSLRTLMTFAASPLRTLSGIGRGFRRRFEDSPQVDRMRKMAGEAPLVLQIETANACNARCVFCAHAKMKRERGIMTPRLFEKVVDDYCAMGGGAVSLTPVVGDALLDPHLRERLRILDARREISQISLTTNAIALDRYSDEDVRYFLKTLDRIQVSIGGLDAETYRTMYGVDRFAQVERAMARLTELRETLSEPCGITFAFRTNDWRFELRFRKKIRAFRRRGIFVSHICSYANYAGLVRKDKDIRLDVIEGGGKRSLPCVYPSVHMAVCWDGRITACGCADFEAEALRIGQAGEESLAKVWSGAKRLAILNAFGAGRPPGICRACSAYQPDSAVFSEPYCTAITDRRSLPPEYFQHFWGG